MRRQEFHHFLTRMDGLRIASLTFLQAFQQLFLKTHDVQDKKTDGCRPKQEFERLQVLYPGVRFVWLMGADNLAQLHRWQKWDWIMCNVPIAVFARPGTRLAARGSRAAEEYARYRVRAEDAQLLSAMRAPAWVFLDMPLNDISSSEIRARGEWRGGRWKR